VRAITIGAVVALGLASSACFLHIEVGRLATEAPAAQESAADDRVVEDATVVPAI
jgi:hypothetical protein